VKTGKLEILTAWLGKDGGTGGKDGNTDIYMKVFVKTGRLIKTKNTKINGLAYKIVY